MKRYDEFLGTLRFDDDPVSRPQRCRVIGERKRSYLITTDGSTLALPGYRTVFPGQTSWVPRESIERRLESAYLCQWCGKAPEDCKCVV